MKRRIWIPAGEVKKHFRSIKRNLHKRLAKELRQDPEYKIHIKPLDVRFSVCKVNDYSGSVDQTILFYRYNG